MVAFHASALRTDMLGGPDIRELVEALKRKEEVMVGNKILEYDGRVIFIRDVGGVPSTCSSIDLLNILTNGEMD